MFQRFFFVLLIVAIAIAAVAAEGDPIKDLLTEVFKFLKEVVIQLAALFGITLT